MNESSACLEFPPENCGITIYIPSSPSAGVGDGDQKSSPGYRQNGFSSNRLPDFREVIQQKNWIPD